MFILLVAILNMSCFACLFAERNVGHPIFVWTVSLWSFNVVMSLSLLISTRILYMSPHDTLNNSFSQHTAHDLLECAARRIPEQKRDWYKIDDCLTKVNTYNISNGRLPYLRSTGKHRNAPTVAFVLNGDEESIFLTSEYQRLDVNSKALVLIHECAHIGLGAVDHAYRWEPEFLKLTVDQHYENADSFMDSVLYHCT